jgi:hypothetical protein
VAFSEGAIYEQCPRPPLSDQRLTPVALTLTGTAEGFEVRFEADLKKYQASEERDATVCCAPATLIGVL